MDHRCIAIHRLFWAPFTGKSRVTVTGDAAFAFPVSEIAQQRARVQLGAQKASRRAEMILAISGRAIE